MRAKCAGLVVLLCVIGGAGCTWVQRDAYMGVIGRALKSKRRPDRALNYESQPMCGSTGPTLFPFARERYAHTPIRVRVLDNARARTACSVDITGREWRAFDALAEDEYWVYLELDGLVNQLIDPRVMRMRHGYKIARQHPLTVASHVDITVKYINRNNGSEVEVMNWGVEPTYRRLEPGKLDWTYSVTWVRADPGTSRSDGSYEDGTGTHVRGMQFISIIICFMVTLFVSIAMNLTIRRFVAPYIVDGFAPLHHFNCGACIQLSRSSMASESISDGGFDEELCLMGKDTMEPASTAVAQWRHLVDDVFRIDGNGTVITVLSGIGTYLFLSTAMIVCIGAFGGESYMRMAVWVCGIVAALPSGYTCGMVRFFMRVPRVNYVAVFCSFITPACVVTVTLIANAALLAEDSVYAVPLNTAVLMLMAWWLIVGLLFFGGFAMYRNASRQPRVGPVPRQMPKWSFVDACLFIFNGVGVWLGVAAPMFIIISSIWTTHIIHVRSTFILLLASLFMWMVLTSSFAIMFTYTTLNRGRWKWSSVSFFGAAASAVPSVLLFTIYYVSNNFHGAMGKIVYTCQAVAAIATTSLSAGTASLLTSTLFVRALYNTARLE